MAAIGVFVEKYGAKYPKAADCLPRGSEALLAFYDFPADTETICAPRMVPSRVVLELGSAAPGDMKLGGQAASAMG